MRILHTSDWHLGRRLGRYDRAEEFAAVCREIEGIARERAVDLVLVSGDLFDRPVPPLDVLRMGIEALRSLAEQAPVVVVAGNHDAPELFDTLTPLLAPQRVHLVGSIRRPEEGGVLGPDELGVPAVVGCLPFLREGRVVDFMRDAGTWYGAYADRVAALCRTMSDALVRRAGTELVALLMAHFLVSGVRIDREAPRGERELHLGEAYAATAQAIPPGPQYVAMGHIHAPQPVPGAPVPAEYAGSPLPLDFGEAGERKRVAIVEVEPGRLATVTSVELAAGRPLVRAQGRWSELEARAEELADAYVDLTVDARDAAPDLADRARERFPFLVRVRAARPAGAPGAPVVEGHRSLPERYADYRREVHGRDPEPELLALFRELLDELDAPV